MNNKQNHFTTLCKALLPTLFALIVQVVVYYLAFKVVKIKVNIDFARIAAAPGQNPELVSGEIFNSAIERSVSEILYSADFNDTVSLLTFLALITVFTAWFFLGKHSKGQAPAKEAFHPLNVIIVFISGFLLQIGTSVFLNVLLPYFPKTAENYMQLMENLTGQDSVISILTIVVLAPIAEELIFRGVTLRGMRRFWPFVPVVGLQALLFGIYHMNIVQGIYAFVCGLFLGYVAYKLNNVLISMLFHAVVNGSSYLLPYILSDGVFANLLVAILVGIVCFIIIVALFALLKLPEPVEESEFTVSAGVVADKVNKAISTDSPLSRVDFTAPVRTPDILGDIDSPDAASEESENSSQENVDISEKEAENIENNQ